MDIKTITLENEGFRNEIKQMIATDKLIPIIGSGFTRGEKTPNGIVPSGGDMKEKMIKDIISADSDYTLSELQNKDF